MEAPQNGWREEVWYWLKVAAVCLLMAAMISNWIFGSNDEEEARFERDVIQQQINEVRRVAQERIESQRLEIEARDERIEELIAQNVRLTVTLQLSGIEVPEWP